MVIYTNSETWLAGIITGVALMTIIYFGLYIIFIGEYKCKKCNMEIFKGVNFCKYCGQKQIPV